MLALTNPAWYRKNNYQQKLPEILLNPDIAKVIYNSKAALNLLHRENLSLANITFDPMLASYICSPDQKHDLLEQAERLLNYYIPHTLVDTKKKKYISPLIRLCSPELT